MLINIELSLLMFKVVKLRNKSWCSVERIIMLKDKCVKAER